jgi:hypothetical protein
MLFHIRLNVEERVMCHVCYTGFLVTQENELEQHF